MRAAILTQVPTAELVIADDVTLRPIEPGEVKVKVAHSGVCHSDLSVMTGTIPMELPAVLGHEGAGVVTDVGDGVTHVAVGDHVIMAFSPACGTCAYCNERAQASLCITGTFTMMAHKQFERSSETVNSMAGLGAFAEETIVPAMGIIKIDRDVPLDVAALVGCGVTTGVSASLNSAKITPGSAVAIIGCGGVGIAAIQGARIAGAEVIVAIDLHEEKLAQARTFGATHVATPNQIEDVKNELTSGEGFDYAIECIGLAVTMRQAYDLVRRGGTACIVGVGPSDQYLQLNAFEQFFNGKTVVGSMYGSADVRTDFERFLGFYKDGQLDLERMISRRLDLSDMNGALASLGDANIIRQVIDF